MSFKNITTIIGLGIVKINFISENLVTIINSQDNNIINKVSVTINIDKYIFELIPMLDEFNTDGEVIYYLNNKSRNEYKNALWTINSLVNANIEVKYTDDINEKNNQSVTYSNILIKLECRLVFYLHFYHT